jgi:hypothetical protein
MNKINTEERQQHLDKPTRSFSRSLFTIYLFDSLVPPLRKSFAVFYGAQSCPVSDPHTRDHVGLVGRPTADPHFSLISMDVGGFSPFQSCGTSLVSSGLFISSPSVFVRLVSSRHGRNYICRFLFTGKSTI